MEKMKIKALALMSGGLDSTLAAKIIKDLGFEVIGINFYNGFCIEHVQRQIKGAKSCYTPLSVAHSLGINIELLDIADEYLEVVKHPRHGRGAAMNPCIDCRIFMLKKAKGLMEKIEAEFVVTGEVLNQRPLSQHYKALLLIQEESGLGDKLLRPLSAKLLPPAYPVKLGWISQDDLYDIQGRSRLRQLELASKLGITKYSQPAGGCCLLVEKHFGNRLRDAFKYKGKEALERSDFEILKVGRHFRISANTKAIVGRNESENCFLEKFADGKWKITIPDHASPIVLVDGNPAEAELILAARIAARYSDGKEEKLVRAVLQRDGESRVLEVEPLDPQDEILAKSLI